MARPKKTVEVTEQETGLAKVSPLSMSQSIAMMVEIVKADYPEFDGDLDAVLGDRPKDYLYARLNGMSHFEAIQLYNIAPVEVELWTKKPEFASVMGMVKNAEASLVESVTWQMAMNPAANIERMFALKSRKQEYKENGQAQGNTVTNVKISIDGQDFDVSASFKKPEENI